jgi:hypothetical protein
LTPRRWRYWFRPQWAIRNCTIFATVFLFNISLYISLGPVFAPFLMVMRRNPLAVLVFSFHSLSHCFFALFLIACKLVSVKDLWMNGWLDDWLVVSSFASASTLLWLASLRENIEKCYHLQKNETSSISLTFANGERRHTNNSKDFVSIESNFWDVRGFLLNLAGPLTG